MAVTSVLLSTALVAALTSPSFADKKSDLERQKQEANSKAQDAKKHLDLTTKEFAAAAAALQAAQAKLDAAQATLGDTRGKVAVAAAFDAQMQGKLDKSQAELRKARSELAKGEKQLVSSEKSVEEFAVQDYLEGDRRLRAVSGLLSGEDPMAYGEQVSLNAAVSDDQVATMQRLDATRVILRLKRQKVQKLRDKVKVQREQAAANLVQKQQLEVAAEQQAAEVATLVTARESAKTTAAAAQAEDERLYQEQLAETSRLESELQKVVAEELRKAREKAAREKAARERAAREKAKNNGGGGGTSRPTKPVVPDTGDSGGALSRPVSGPTTSSYGMRKHPITGVYKLHDGTDFGVRCGTPVRAAASGKILQQYYNGAYGYRIILNNGVKRGVSVVTTYNHLSRFALRAGSRVERGQVIGYSGTTGYSTGCHLHFMVLVNGSTVNPIGWL
ncbi:M23 family metallopeptidase [Aeromicrobium wangtongii]|uniref:Peptidoglycan DD-metalloendopeptidase family protein n=1 Tax=Aeromicrobium wangtongii TaxID=2969247 RepID=A0ABY5MFJ5_9ACTN|nr:M23 family metallopeptidase [Aeromicrobium wangtongii]MCD9197123.1 peptidoglycan DD-metalloendopeptidase family protein [Aeromicrobium wangtongii]UUP14621.1 peptidoglycan DD-metalloendopeptidase family protein [Aeromicrobium wangtongii]